MRTLARALTLALAAGLAPAAAVAALTFPLDHIAIQEALAIANSSTESTHLRFHADYRVPVNKAPVDFVSIVTPFRRVVLSGETSLRQRGRMFGQREAMASLKPDPDRLEVYVELTFHPHNTFVAVPGYTIALEPLSFRGPAVVPADVVRLSRVGPRLDDTRYPFPYPYPGAPENAAGGDPLVGGTLNGRFWASELEPKAMYEVVVRDGVKELARARIDLARLR